MRMFCLSHGQRGGFDFTNHLLGSASQLVFCGQCGVWVDRSMEIGPILQGFRRLRGRDITDVLVPSGMTAKGKKNGISVFSLKGQSTINPDSARTGRNEETEQAFGSNNRDGGFHPLLYIQAVWDPLLGHLLIVCIVSKTPICKHTT